MRSAQWLALCVLSALASSTLTFILTRNDAGHVHNNLSVKHLQQKRLKDRAPKSTQVPSTLFSSGFGSAVLDSSDSPVDLKSRFLQRQNRSTLYRAAQSRQPRVLILTPVKDGAHHLKRLMPLLESLSYPAHCISVGFLDSDSSDGKHGTAGEQHSLTWRTLVAAVPHLLQHFGRVTLARHDYGLLLSRAERHELFSQLLRRHVMARARNQLLSRALVDEDWVMWVDSDVSSWQPDLIQRLLSANRTIVVPNVVMEPGGRSYDLNSWAARWMNSSRASPGQGVPSASSSGGQWSIHLAAVKQLQLAKEEAAGDVSAAQWGWSSRYYAPLVPLAPDPPSTCLSQVATRQLEGAMPWPFTSKNESGCEAVLGAPMIFKHTGARHAPRGEGLQGGAGGSGGDPEALHPALLLEGYVKHPIIPVHKLRHIGDVVELGGVGGAVLLVWAGLHREGLMFPPFPYRARIETEGLAAMARDMGHRVWAMPHVEVVHT